MEKKHKRQKRINLALLVVLLAGIVASVLIYVERNEKRILAQNTQYLEDDTRQTSENINEFFDDSTKNISLISSLYSKAMTSSEVDIQELQELAQSASFDVFQFISANGKKTTVDGETVDCTNRESYIKGMQGKTGVYARPAETGDGENFLVFYTPLIYREKILGVMLGIYTQEHLTNILASSYFGQEATSYLCLADGSVVASYGDGKAPRNILARQEKKKILDEETRKNIRQVFEDKGSYSYLYERQGKVSNAYITRLPEDGWLLLKTFPSSVNDVMLRQASRDATLLQIVVCAMFAVYLVLVIFTNLRSRKALVNENKNMAMMVKSVTTLYTRFAVLDLEKDTYEYIMKGDFSYLGMPERGRYSDLLRKCGELYIVEENEPPIAERLSSEKLQEELGQKTSYIQAEYCMAAGREKRWEKITMMRLNREGEKVTSVFLAVEDITTLKNEELQKRQALTEAYELAEAANNAKSDFLSRMSHDIRTPMNAIIGMTAIAGTKLDDKERVVDCLNKITMSSKHLLSLINDILDMSKIESGKLNLNEEEFNLADLMENLLDMVRPLVKEKKHNLNMVINGIEHEAVVGDSLRIQQVFLNLMSNAVKYTNEGGNISVSIQERPSKQAWTGCYEFVFEDDGIGMSQEFLERIFQPFERAEDERIHKIQGTGLGMPITLNIVRMMDGDIRVESEPGVGTRFTVTIFLKLQDKVEEVATELEGLPVLVADDDPIACESACVILNELGMRSMGVMSGQEAIDCVREAKETGEDFFAVILDWRMPDIDGIKVAKEIRRMVGDDVPIIIFSGYDWSEIEMEARAAGVDLFVTKPLFKSKLKPIFRNLVNKDVAAQSEYMPLESVQARDYSGSRIMVVEDNELNREIAVEIFEMAGLTVEAAEDGKQAYDMFAASEPGYYKMIFMDIQMPVMNGYDATVAIRALDRRDAKSIPIVAMTANAFAEDVQAAKSCGMNEHIAKPLDEEKLVQVLERWL